MVVRQTRYPIAELFIKRRSQRAMSGEAISHDELMLLFEAARWAPSSFNSQPWRFMYALKGSTQLWNMFFDLLMPANKLWAKNAGALVVVVAQKNFEKTGKPSVTHSYDTGAACQNLALQAFLSGMIAHPIGGFYYDNARHVLQIPDSYAVQVMFAIGRPGLATMLPPEIADTDVVTDRKPLKDIVCEGVFKL